ncbi:MAG: hypothetical protein M1833_000249 [Piccolia ochrophora]|nr:MAG: hypothetical protein M1833_000249 [Piccolia ochrophora]
MLRRPQPLTNPGGNAIVPRPAPARPRIPAAIHRAGATPPSAVHGGASYPARIGGNSIPRFPNPREHRGPVPGESRNMWHLKDEKTGTLRFSGNKLVYDVEDMLYIASLPEQRMTNDKPEDIELVIREIKGGDDGKYKPRGGYGDMRHSTSEEVHRAGRVTHSTNEWNFFWFDGETGKGALASVWSVVRIALTYDQKVDGQVTHYTISTLIDELIRLYGKRLTSSYFVDSIQDERYSKFARAQRSANRAKYGENAVIDKKPSRIVHRVDWNLIGDRDYVPGNYELVRTWDVSDPENPKIVESRSGSYSIKDPSKPVRVTSDLTGPPTTGRVRIFDGDATKVTYP